MPTDVMSRIQQRMTGALPPLSAADQRKIDLLPRAREIPVLISGDLPPRNGDFDLITVFILPDRRFQSPDGFRRSHNIGSPAIVLPQCIVHAAVCPHDNLPIGADRIPEPMNHSTASPSHNLSRTT